MRKFLRQKFWSQGTPLGSLGPPSFEALGPGFDQCQILLIWGPYEYLDLVALQVQAEILKTIRSWCAISFINQHGLHLTAKCLPRLVALFVGAIL